MKAYEVLERYGWRQGEFGETKKGFCLLGALRFAYPRRTLRLLFWKRILARIGRRGSVLASATSWNDTRGRTKTQVIRLLRELNL